MQIAALRQGNHVFNHGHHCFGLGFRGLDPIVPQSGRRQRAKYGLTLIRWPAEQMTLSLVTHG
jgi:hypothetical protein